MRDDLARLKRIHEFEQAGEFIIENFIPLVRRMYLAFIEQGFDHETALYLTTLWMRTSLDFTSDADR